jgi:response regulator RpfG family c-di-GMP phosphodiesterase
MNDLIMLLDDDVNVLSGYKRNFRNKYDIIDVSKPDEAIKIFSKHDKQIKVVVSDYKMPGMDGIQFLYLVKNVSPDTVRIMLTGYAELKTAVKAVNEGNIFRFLTKPCQSDILAAAIDAGISQYNLVTVEREVLDKTLKGIIKVLTDILAAVNPVYYSKASRLRNFARGVAEALDFEKIWEVEIAALLSQIGIVTFPPELLDKAFKGNALSEQENQMLLSLPLVGETLLKNIPRLEQIAESIFYQHKRYDGSDGTTRNKIGEAIPLIGRILKVVDDYDNLVSHGASNPEALKIMQDHSSYYDPNVLVALKSATASEGKGYVLKSIPAEDLKPGMIIAENINDSNGQLLLAKGNEITNIILFRLSNSFVFRKYDGNIKVFVPLNL